MKKLSPLPESRGFTLIELMIVVAVIGILLAIAVPNYQEYILRSKLLDAGSSLAQLRVNLEQYFQDNRSFDANPATPAGTCGVIVTGSNSKYFTYTCATGNIGQTFLITATGVAGGGTGSFGFTIDQSNNRVTTGLPTGWAASTPATCWVTAKGQASC